MAWISRSPDWNIGFLDVCHQPCEELVQAARRPHERIYAIATGEAEPYDVAIDYLPINTL